MKDKLEQENPISHQTKSNLKRIKIYRLDKNPLISGTQRCFSSFDFHAKKIKTYHGRKDKQVGQYKIKAFYIANVGIPPIGIYSPNTKNIN